MVSMSRRHLREKSAPQERVPHSAFHIALPVAHTVPPSLSLSSRHSGKWKGAKSLDDQASCTLTEMAAPDGAVTFPF